MEKQPSPFLFFLNYQINQQLFLSRLKKINFVLGSSEEQLNLYRKIGIRETSIVKIPLFFDQDRIIPISKENQPYFVIIGQNRHEKGMHLISSILEQVKMGIRVKLLFFNEEEAAKFISENPINKKHLESGKLEILPGITMTNGAIELIAASCGVINPTIWSTTTEFVLLETLGLSKPIITFAVGVHKEVIRNRVNGICVEPGDFKAMGNEINYLSSDIELQNRIASNANKLYHSMTDEMSFYKPLRTVFK